MAATSKGRAVNCVTLPWPPKELSPNSSAKLKDKMSAKRKYRDDCYVLALASLAKTRKAYGGDIPITIEFRYPDAINRDLDNQLNRIKAGLDSVANAMRVDDSRFNPITIRRGPITKGGQVIVCIGT